MDAQTSIASVSQTGGEVLNSSELLSCAVKGDKQAFCCVYSLYKNKLYKYAFYRLGNKEDAEDAVQDCVLCAYRQISSLKNIKAFESWLFKILSACCSEKIKHIINAKNSVGLEQAEKFLKSETGAVEKTELTEALGILSEEEREIVLLSCVAGFKSREIASFMDMTSGSVRSKLSRSLKKMRTFLE